MQFEWDESKRQATLSERGIDFIDAAMVWDDPKRQERIDNRKHHGETRIQTIGRVHFGILFVVYTERVQDDSQEAIRIISVRKASKRDREEYEKMTFHLRRIS